MSALDEKVIVGYRDDGTPIQARLGVPRSKGRAVLLVDDPTLCHPVTRIRR